MVTESMISRRGRLREVAGSVLGARRAPQNKALQMGSQARGCPTDGREFYTLDPQGLHGHFLDSQRLLNINVV